MKDYTNSAMRAAIDEHVHDRRHRAALTLIFCEGLTYEETAEAVAYSPEYIKKIVGRYKEALFEHV